MKNWQNYWQSGKTTKSLTLKLNVFPQSSTASSPVEVDAGSPVSNSSAGSPEEEAAGPQLYTISWPVENCVAHVYILHGYAEHCER